MLQQASEMHAVGESGPKVDGTWVTLKDPFADQCRADVLYSTYQSATSVYIAGGATRARSVVRILACPNHRGTQ